jgi:DNA-directed RNA polymerase subunit beta
MLRPDKVRNFSKVGDAAAVPDLISVQQTSYARFLQADAAADKRRADGLEGLLREIFPIVSYDENTRLDYISYELGEPRYTADECRDLKLTYGMPFKIRCRLSRKDSKDVLEESIYLGEIPIMIGGGEFIINGAERVIVSQLHRSPGVDFNVELQESDRPLHGARIIPERGSWVELSVTKKDSLSIRIDQSSRIAATTFLRAMDPKYGKTADIIREFYATRTISTDALRPQMYVVEAVVDPESGEELVPAGGQIGENQTKIQASKLKSIEVIDKNVDPLILNTVSEDPADTHENALLRIYMRLRPGNPPQIDKAKALFKEKFYDENRYRLGKVGRFRVNRKFGQDVPESIMTLRPEDFAGTLKYIMKLRGGDGVVDDIDHLGNRRLRTIDELAAEELRKGFLKLRRTVQERMSLKDPNELTKIAELVNSKSISSSIDFFFGRGELSQVVDQQNPLSQLTHERRLSALGPGGLNRKRAGFEVRDVHISHYGRICPIETPEGDNIGLISSLSIYAGVDEYGFLTTPYRKVEKGKVVEEIAYLRADEEMELVLASPDSLRPGRGGAEKLPEDHVLVRAKGEVTMVGGKDVDYIDISPKQTVGVSAAMIPFLEHDDANRALMGSNMQRQAVPLLRSEPPIVATGMERPVAENSGMVIRARKGGVVTYVDAQRIIIDNADEYEFRKFVKLNERTCLNQKPIVREGQRVKKNQIIADGSSTRNGELALGRNVLVAFMPFDGYNFEDAILISERLLKEDTFTSVHMEEYEVEIRETKLGREEFTRDIPNVSEKALRNLDERGVIRVGTRVGPGDILVGKVAPKSKSELSPEEKLLHAIFGRAGEDVKNDSLELPAGEEGVVVEAKRFSRRVHMTDDQKKDLARAMKDYEAGMNARMIKTFRKMTEEINDVLGQPMIDPSTRQKVGQSEIEEVIIEQIQNFSTRWIKGAERAKEQGVEIHARYWPRIEEIQKETKRKLEHMKRGDELPSGVLEMVKVRVATKRKLGVGDKMAGRHGNKGVIAKIMQEEDMPFLADGTPVDIVLNPLGVPSRMNVGQILETHLGWAAAVLGFQAVTPVFDGATEEEIVQCIREANEHVRKRAYAERVWQLRSAVAQPLAQTAGDFSFEGCPCEPDKILEHVQAFCAGNTSYRRSDEGKDLDRQVRDWLRSKFYSERFLTRYTCIAVDDAWNKADLKVVEQALVAKYRPAFNREGVGGEVGPLAGKRAELFDRCVKAIESKSDWAQAPKACGERRKGLYIFASSSGSLQYIGIAAGKKGLAGRLDDHFGQSQNSYGDNLIKRFAEAAQAAWDAKRATSERFSEAEYAASVGIIQNAGNSRELLAEMPEDSKVQLHDGRTGEPFEQKTTVGYIYMNKLHHLVDEKIHARATGPYSLITQQPLGGKARTGGQRFGEMEVWGLEAYGASYTLQELLTVKSDDVEGRTKIYESMVKGTNTLEAGTPVSFDVLCNELRGLGLNIQLEKKKLI